MKAMMIVALALVSSVGFAHGRHHSHHAVGTAFPQCSTGGDETSRPVFNARGQFVGYECVQDNRGGNGG